MTKHEFTPKQLQAVERIRASMAIEGYSLTGVPLPAELRQTKYPMALWPAPVEKLTEKGTPFELEARDIDIAEDIDDAILTARLAEIIDREPYAPTPPMILDSSARPIKLDIDLDKMHELEREDRRQEWLLDIQTMRDLEPEP